DLHRPCLAEGQDARIEPMHHGAEGEEVEVAGIFAKVQPAHGCSESNGLSRGKSHSIGQGEWRRPPWRQQKGTPRRAFPTRIVGNALRGVPLLLWGSNGNNSLIGLFPFSTIWIGRPTGVGIHLV